MSLVVVACEGSTERKFLNEVVRPAIPGISFAPINLGGNVALDRVLDALEDASKDRQYRGAFFSTFLDLYGLGRGWSRSPFHQGAMEDQIRNGLVGRVPDERFFSRFRPHVQPHEFESLLFSDPQRMAEGLGRPDLAEKLQDILDEFGSPEVINNSPQTSPSNRLKVLLGGGYNKPTRGKQAALAVTLDAMIRECPHFAAWVEWLRSLPSRIAE